jgi:hypothetical protein
VTSAVALAFDSGSGAPYTGVEAVALPTAGRISQSFLVRDTSALGQRVAFVMAARTPPGPTPTPGPMEPASDFVWPADGPITSLMSPSHPGGIDIGVPVGAAIRAVRDGRVVVAGGDVCCGYGYYVVIEHEDGWSSLYAHLSAFSVQAGDVVQQGQRLGLAGRTGKAEGAHLHFELRAFGLAVNPIPHLPYRTDIPSPEVFAVTEPPMPTPTAEGQPGASPAAPPPVPPPAASLPAVPPVRAEGLSAGGAIALAIPWMTAQPGTQYAVEAGDCQASRAGPNWLVTCEATLSGCPGGDECFELLSACVIEQPRLVTDYCPV